VVYLCNTKYKLLVPIYGNEWEPFDSIKIT